MSDMKCPFCQQELVIDPCGEMGCLNEKCKESMFLIGTKELWQALIDTKKKLDVAVDALNIISQITNQIDVCDTANDALDQIDETKGGKDGSN